MKYLDNVLSFGLGAACSYLWLRRSAKHDLYETLDDHVVDANITFANTDRLSDTIEVNSIMTDDYMEQLSGSLVIKKYDLLDSALHRECQRIPVSSVEYDRPILKFKTDATIRDVLTGMRGESCTCAVVYKGASLCGIIDVTDIVSYMVQNGLDVNDTIRGCIRKMVYVYSNSNLLEVAQYLKSGFRYIVVQDPRQPSIVSQGSVIRYIYINQSYFEQRETLESTIRELEICNMQKILTVNSSDSVLKAYDLMVRKNITSLPVVDDHGIARAVLGMSDVRFLVDVEYDSLFDLPCLIFLQTLKLSREIVTCDLDVQLGEVLRLMIEHHINQVYITETSGIPIGVVSFVDIIKAIF
jgi:CBS domain-containing protein